MAKDSKKLGHYDECGFEFSKEMLGDMPTAAINFERLQKHPQYGYIIFEYLLCEEKQKVTPHTSHPNRYWDKNKRKFLALWRARNDFRATLYLINYAQKDTAAGNEVLVIEVQDMDENGITREQMWMMTRAEFAQWFQRLNAECLEGEERLYEEIYWQKTIAELGQICFPKGKYEGRTIGEIYEQDKSYLEFHKTQGYPYSKAVEVYLMKQEIEWRNKNGAGVYNPLC